MPELPEVEVIAQGLSGLLTGQEVLATEFVQDAVARGDAPKIRRELPGREITAAWRRAKLLILDLAPKWHLVFHLKMSGRVLVQEGPVPLASPVRLLLGLDHGQALVFEDVRKFGYVRLFDPPGLQTWTFFAKLGPEPFDLDPTGFIRLFKGRQARIKALLLDQTVIAGLGNIYTDEALFRAKINPATPASQLGPQQLAALHASIMEVLDRGIKAGGTSLRDYVNALGRPGDHQLELLVYGRCGQGCPVCGQCLDKTKIAGRSSVYCPNCQPKPDDC